MQNSNIDAVVSAHSRPANLFHNIGLTTKTSAGVLPSALPILTEVCCQISSLARCVAVCHRFRSDEPRSVVPKPARCCDLSIWIHCTSMRQSDFSPSTSRQYRPLSLNFNVISGQIGLQTAPASDALTFLLPSFPACQVTISCQLGSTAWGAHSFGCVGASDGNSWYVSQATNFASIVLDLPRTVPCTAPHSFCILRWVGITNRLAQ